MTDKDKGPFKIHLWGAAVFWVCLLAIVIATVVRLVVWIWP